MGSKYVSNFACSSQKAVSMKQSCKCGDCDSSWLLQGWQCPGDTTPIVPEVHHSVGRQRSTVCVTVPQTVIGCLLGARGEALKSLKEVTTCNIHIDDRYDEHGTERAMRTASISAREGNEAARESAVDLCARTLRIIGEEKMEIAVALSRAMMEVDAENEKGREAEAQEKASQIKEKEDELVCRVAASVGDLFSTVAIRDALEKENWCADLACDRLFNGHVVDEPVKPALNMQKLLAAARAATAERTMKEGTDVRSSVKVVHKATATICDEPSKNVMMIRDVFTKFRAKEAMKAKK